MEAMEPFSFLPRDFALSGFMVMLLVGIACALVFAVFRAKRAKADIRAVVVSGLAAVLSGIVGARGFSLLFEGGTTLVRNPPFFSFGNGDLSVWGGLLAGVPVGVLCLKLFRASPAKAVDLLAPPLALGLFLGRIGCLLTGCCWGAMASHSLSIGMLPPDESWPMFLQWIIFEENPEMWRRMVTDLGYPENQIPCIPLYPVQAALAIAALALLVLLLWIEKRRKGMAVRDGGQFGLFVFLFALAYCVIGLWRADTLPVFLIRDMLAVNPGQCAALAAMAIVLAVKIIARRSGNEPAAHF